MPLDRNKVQQHAEKLIAAGKVEAGIAQYQLLVNENRRDLGTLNKIGDLYVRLNKRADAIHAFTRIAEIYAEDGFFLKAIAIYKKITKIDPSHLETLQRLADLYSKQGLKTEARAQYSQVAESYLKAGQQQKAIAAYESLAAMEPDNTQSRLAVADLKARAGLSSDAARTYTDIARDLDRKGRSRESLPIYDLALRTGRSDPAVVEGICLSLSASGQHEKAAAVAEEILRSHPDNVAVLEARGLALAALGRGGEAEKALRTVLARDPGRSGSVLALARLLIGRGALPEAHQAISSGLDAVVAASLSAEALKILEEILAQSPSNRAAMEDLYRLRSVLGDKAGTLAIAERLLAACMAENRHSEALALARRIVELDPSVPAHRERLQQIQDLAEGREVKPPAEPPAVTLSSLPPEVDEIDLAAEVPAGEEEAPPREAPPPMAEEEPSGEGLEPGAEPTLTPEDEEFITERATEADVFVKYGLADRAIEVLIEILDRFPWHLPTRLRLRDVHLEEGNRTRAANEAATIGRILLERGDREGAMGAVREARSIDASCPAIQEVETLLGEAVAGEVPVPPAIFRPPLVEEEEVTDIIIEEGETIEESAGVPSAPPAPPAEDLEEFDFYLKQGMHDEAASVLSRLEASHGPHPELETRRAALGEAAGAGAEAAPVEAEVFVEAEGEVETAAEPAAVEEEAPQPVEEAKEKVPAQAAAPAAGFFDLAAELDSSLFTAQEAGEEEALTALETTPEGHSLDEIVSAFKRGIEQQVDAEDFETHYQLGIAYKEMGLNEEAIAEFQFASKDPRLMPDCCSMLGICFREKGMLSLAVKWYRKGLDALAPAGDEERLNGVRYDLADVLAQMGDYRPALDLFLEVYGVDSRYRDVALRVKDLEKRLKP